LREGVRVIVNNTQVINNLFFIFGLVFILSLK
jgi:hypothetical protein